MQRHGGANGPDDREDREPLGDELAWEEALGLRGQTQGTSSHRDAPTSGSPREEAEGALSSRTCLTASAAHFRSAEGSG